MKSPWGDIALSDAHVHFFSDGFFSALARQKGAPIAGDLAQLGFEAPDPDPVKLAERWAQELDRHGLRSSTLIASVPGDEGSVLSAVRAFPKRFHGYFMIDPTQDGADRRLQEAIEGGLRGVCLFPAMHRYSIGDDRVVKLLEWLAGRAGTVVFVHCGVLSVGIRAKLGLPSRFDMRFSSPIDLHAIALRFPQLPFVIPHFGAGFFREALMVADLCPNVYFDTSSTNSWTKYQTPAVDLREVFRISLDLLGPDRLLFGSDSSWFPRGWHRAIFDTQAQLLFDLGLGIEDARLVFGENLRRLLKFS